MPLMDWRKKRQSKNIEDRRGAPDIGRSIPVTDVTKVHEQQVQGDRKLSQFSHPKFEGDVLTKFPFLRRGLKERGMTIITKK